MSMFKIDDERMAAALDKLEPEEAGAVLALIMRDNPKLIALDCYNKLCTKLAPYWAARLRNP